MVEYSNQLDMAFHALSDATRRGILDRLSRGPASVSELAKPYESSFAAILQHVQVLEASGLIVTEKRGRTRECRISSNAVQRVEQWLSERRQLWESRFDRLGILLENDSPVDAGSPHSETNGDKS
ncbi:ArsR/SmtB family transcription factor [Sinorhizobium meliloti]|uniref:ArsR/SmtB family transcription factor n=1 Tax=Rhizobium meliloti TaxID=382 RepID=UPI000B4987A0|nr:metalloregulator ArsR/SmtB family transcription factor [Sinorhizobium meliloti]ASP87042.1 ArsR family transcriptional regulator [Sinorhizobium meliloti]MQW30896.1 metalloregulator ArsR/SmtB family transcription factor [Sinorhizobium meliloti]RVJ54242.1 ArsR family transcriptional regulator [Sinorhizobium meliloti]RVJ75872.1 ArsR family transcriptional regulator [Sinorhizobium meliloti]RVJ99100.1 ArsR family transcriptional regulator [Sinorhizobium meliloti]